MNRVITLIAATAGTLGLAGTAAAQQNPVDPDVINDLPREVLESVIDGDDEEAPDGAETTDEEWVAGERVSTINCADPSVRETLYHIRIQCGPGTRFRTEVEEDTFVFRFDYGGYECPGFQGALDPRDGRDREWPSESCIALWRQVDARKHHIIDRFMRAVENGWRIEFTGRTMSHPGLVALESYSFSNPD